MFKSKGRIQIPMILIFCIFAGCASMPAKHEPVFFPPLPAEPHLQYLTTYNKAEDILKKPSAFATYVLGEKRKLTEIVKPYGITTHAGKIYICDTKSPVIHVLDPKNKIYAALGVGVIRKPINIFFDSDGTAFVADAELNQVVVFDSEGRYLRSMGDSTKIHPSDVAVKGEELFVCDIKTHSILVWNKNTGEEIRSIGKPGSAEGDFFQPTNIAFDSEGCLYVSDTGNFRIQKLDLDGKVVKVFGGIGFSLGKFSRPKGIALDDQDQLFALDTAFENVQIFDKEGRLLLFFGEPGSKPWQINMPAKIALSRDLIDYYQPMADQNFHIEYLVYITSQFGKNKVNVYGFGHYQAPDQKNPNIN
jgi:sugar lactone lactonase YvrE